MRSFMQFSLNSRPESPNAYIWSVNPASTVSSSLDPSWKLDTTISLYTGPFYLEHPTAGHQGEMRVVRLCKIRRSWWHPTMSHNSKVNSGRELVRAFKLRGCSTSNWSFKAAKCDPIETTKASRLCAACAPGSIGVMECVDAMYCTAQA